MKFGSLWQKRQAGMQTMTGKLQLQNKVKRNYDFKQEDRNSMKEYIKSLRQIVGTIPIILTGASVIVENRQGEILLIQRSDTKSWGYPGGSVEINEVVEEAAKRELFEETGLTANSLELFGVFSGKELYFVFPHGDEVSIVDIVYLCNDYTGEARADFQESDKVNFFALESLPNNISPPCIPALKKYREIKR